MKIIYMGTPRFAVQPLQKLLQNQFEVVAVVTVPDKPAGRGLKLQQSEVKMYAQSQNLLVLQPENLKSPEFIQQLKLLNADLFVVVAFRILPEEVFCIPQYGSFNLHASLLPSYRGAAPIHHAIINGEKVTGVTTFFLNKGVDTGEIIHQQTIDIDNNDNVGTLHDKLMNIGAEVVVKTCFDIQNGTVKTQKQPENGISLAPKLTRENTQIKFHWQGKQIYDFVRGLNPYPAAWTTIFIPQLNIETTCKIFEATYHKTSHQFKTGTMEIHPIENSFKIYCSDGYLSILRLQPAGKKSMTVEEWLRGLHLSEKIII